MQNKFYNLIAGNNFEKVISHLVHTELKNPQKWVNMVGEVDLTNIELYRNKQQTHRPSYTAFIMKAAAHALKENPIANRRRLPKPFWPFYMTQSFSTCDIAAAIEREMPNAPSVAMLDVVRGVENLNVHEITEVLKKFSQATIETSTQWKTFYNAVTKLPLLIIKIFGFISIFTPSNWVKYRGGAVLISSPAKYGAADLLVGAWPSPIGISFGHVKERAVVKNGNILPVRTVYLTMSFDRTILAGAPAAKFFGSMVNFLENFE